MIEIVCEFVVDGNPLEDLMTMDSVTLVIKNGEVAFASGEKPVVEQ